LNAALNLDGVTKSFGSKAALSGLTLSVPEGSVFGFIGRNGAGKTTAMRIAAGLLPAGGGSVSIFGQAVAFGRTHPGLGYLRDVPEFYGYLTPAEYLSLSGRLTGMNQTDAAQSAKKLLGEVGLDADSKRRIGGFSRGMKQRLGLAQALIGSPRLLICDEPTSALDPPGRREMLELLEKLRGRATVVFSTHVLSDVERICDRVGVIESGKLVLEGSLSDIKQRYRAGSALISFASPEEAKRFSLERGLTADGASVRAGVDSPEKGRELLLAAASSGLNIVRFEMQEPTLEDIFLEAAR